MSLNKILALDIETTGLDPWRDEILMVGLWDGDVYRCIRSPGALAEYLGLTYEDWDLVGHNVAFDIKFLEVKGWWKPDDRTIHDTKILAHLVKRKVPQEFIERYEALRREENKKLPKGQTHREASPLSLKVLAPWYLKVPMFWETPGNHDNEEYNQKDCMYTYRLFQILSEQVKAEGSWDFYTKRMLEWSKMVREMEIKGISISLEELTKVEDEYTKKRDDLKQKLDSMWMGAHQAYRFRQQNELLDKYNQMAEAQIEKLRWAHLQSATTTSEYNEKVQKTRQKYVDLYKKALPKMEMKLNYDSPSQMSWLLKEHLKLDITDSEGEESTAKGVLHKLASQGREDIKTYLDYREAEKVLTMYVPTYKELQIDGVIHPSFNLTGTRTGRTSSSSPNLQQVPSKLYRLFKPRPGYKFVQYDLSGIEAALIALYSGDRTLFDMLDRGESIHDYNAKALFDLDCPVSEVKKLYPKQRQCAKNLGFACFYGAGSKRIQAVFATAGFPITDSQAKEKLKNLKATYPKVFEFHKEITEDVEAGATIYNLLGRPVNIQPHENAYMTGFNTLIQGSASDLNLRACEKFWKEWQTHGGVYPLLVIHDCIMTEAEDQVAEQAAATLVKHMTSFNLNSEHGLIKLKVEGGVSHEWAK